MIKAEKNNIILKEKRMKKLSIMLVLAVAILLIAGCGASNKGAAKAEANSETSLSQKNSTESQDKKSKSETKTLVVYYSRSGNTAEISRQIQQQVGGDILSLQTITPYPSEYRETTEQAKKEFASGYKPPLQPINLNIQDYDTIYIGSPCWWGGIAPPVITFLSEHDLSGKTILPFSTYGSTGLGHTVTDIKKFAPSANVLEGFAVPGSDVKNAQSDLAKWLEKVGQGKK